MVSARWSPSARTPASPRLATPLLAALLLVAPCLSGCGADEGEQPPPGRPCSQPDLPSAATRVSYEPDHMLCVHLDMAADDFEVLRKQNRFGVEPKDAAMAIGTHLTEDCTSAYPQRFTWFEGDVVIDGMARARVGVRKKGFLGSVLGEGLHKPSFKIKTDKFVPSQSFAGQERVTLNNGVQDISRMRVCVAYAIFRQAGYPAPRCNLANVMLGERALGAFAHVEPVKRRFLRRWFTSDAGDLYEGTLADFTVGHIAGMGQGRLGRWEAETSATDPEGGPLRALTFALQSPDDELLEAVGKIVDIDRFITFWALEVLIGHIDGYGTMRNNFYVYFDPGRQGRAVFLPWGADNVLNDASAGEAELAGAEAGERSARASAYLARYTFAELPRRLARLPAVRKRLIDELDRLRREVWRPAPLVAMVEGFAAQLASAQDDPRVDGEVTALIRWLEGRDKTLQAFIDAGLPASSADGPSCMALPDSGITDPQSALHLLLGVLLGT